jgi:hypothetical protein
VSNGFLLHKLRTLNSTEPGLFKWCSRLYRNQGSLFFAPAPLDWGEQIIVVTGGEFTWTAFGSDWLIRDSRPALGSSGVGELVANTLAVRNVTVVVLDIKPIITENCEIPTLNLLVQI